MRYFPPQKIKSTPCVYLGGFRWTPSNIRVILLGLFLLQNWRIIYNTDGPHKVAAPSEPLMNVIVFFRYAYNKPVILRGLTDNTVSSSAVTLTTCTRTCVVLTSSYDLIGLWLYSRNSDFCARNRLYSHSLGTERWSSARQTLTLTRKVRTRELKMGKPPNIVRFLTPHCCSVPVYVPFREYVGELLRPQAPDALGSGEKHGSACCRPNIPNCRHGSVWEQVMEALVGLCRFLCSGGRLKL